MSEQPNFERIRRDLERRRRQLLNLKAEDDDQPIRDEEENPDNTVMARDYQILEVEARLDLMNSQRVEKINQALERLDNGTYGVCQSCGRPIHPERLQANPSADLCSDCQTRQDHQEAAQWNG